jgi:hypothetical protein
MRKPLGMKKKEKWKTDLLLPSHQRVAGGGRSKISTNQVKNFKEQKALNHRMGTALMFY